jgi:hypothetical protein
MVIAGETPRDEDLEVSVEAEPVSPEGVVDAAATALEGRAEADAAPEPVKKAKNYLKEGGLYAYSVGSGVTQIVIGLVRAALEIAYETAKSKGKMTLGKAFDITKHRLSMEGKREKKS